MVRAHIEGRSDCDSNPAPERPSGLRPERATSRQRAISLGRLEQQKGFDRLIDAFALISSDVPDWDLAIYGEGSQRDELTRRIREARLEGRVFLMEPTTDVMAELVASDLYVHAARYEGYPNAVLEALAAGLCVVAMDCPGATAEILAGGKFGMLVPDNEISALAVGMKQAMTQGAVREGFAALAPQALADIAPSDVARRWLDEINHCRGVTTN